MEWPMTPVPIQPTVLISEAIAGTDGSDLG